MLEEPFLFVTVLLMMGTLVGVAVAWLFPDEGNWPPPSL